MGRKKVGVQANNVYMYNTYVRNVALPGEESGPRKNARSLQIILT